MVWNAIRGRYAYDGMLPTYESLTDTHFQHGALNDDTSLEADKNHVSTAF